VYVDQKSRVIVDSQWFCESARPAVGEVIRRGSGDTGHQTRKWLYKHDKLTECCRAFTLVLASLSCKFNLAQLVLSKSSLIVLCLRQCLWTSALSQNTG